jgi:hypothetical protein
MWADRYTGKKENMSRGLVPKSLSFFVGLLASITIPTNAHAIAPHVKLCFNSKQLPTKRWHPAAHTTCRPLPLNSKILKVVLRQKGEGIKN